MLIKNVKNEYRRHRRLKGKLIDIHQTLIIMQIWSFFVTSIYINVSICHEFMKDNTYIVNMIRFTLNNIFKLPIETNIIKKMFSLKYIRFIWLFFVMSKIKDL